MNLFDGACPVANNDLASRINNVSTRTSDASSGLRDRRIPATIPITKGLNRFDCCGTYRLSNGIDHESGSFNWIKSVDVLLKSP